MNRVNTYQKTFEVAECYRYTFNGKETDTETDLQDYGMRIYNPRLGKFLSVDPLRRSYPELTPYQFASNTPICAVDVDGQEMYYAADGTYIGQIGNSTAVHVVANADIKLFKGYVLRAALTTDADEQDRIRDMANKRSKDLGMTNEELNIRIFLTLIRYTENRDPSLAIDDPRQTPLEYNKMYGGSTFQDYSKHPNKAVKKWGFSSTAAGGYAFVYNSWKEQADKLGLKDFSPESQDKAAVGIMKDKGAFNDIIKGNFNAAYSKVGESCWASLPGGVQQKATPAEALIILRRALVAELKGTSIIATPQGDLLPVSKPVPTYLWPGPNDIPNIPTAEPVLTHPGNVPTERP